MFVAIPSGHKQRKQDIQRYQLLLTITHGNKLHSTSIIIKLKFLLPFHKIDMFVAAVDGHKMSSQNI